MKKYIDMRVIRTIHPAGFGAFCTERFSIGHRIFNMVYDCGSTSQNYEQVVYTDAITYFQEDVIDLLCISHFDEDHINVLRTLIEEGKYIQPGKTTILLPYIAKKYGIFAQYDDSLPKYNEFCSYIEDQGFKRIFVRPFSEEERVNENIEPRTINLGEENQTTIASGTPLMPSNDIPFWLYIPLFIFDDKVYTDIITALTADEKYPALSQEDIDGIANGHLSKNILDKFKNVCKIHGLTGKGTNKANMNSMMLLSTPYLEDLYIPSFIEHGMCACAIYRHCHCCHKHCTRPLRMSSCLYTGDISLNANITQAAIAKYKDLYFKDGVGLLQIPHHGAWGCYNLQTVKDINCEAAFVNTDLEVENPKRPIFYSQMVRDFNNMEECLYLVLKEQDTILIQEIFI